MATGGNGERTGPARDGRLLYPGALLLFLVVALTPAAAQTPLGKQVQVGAAGLPGVGLQAGYLAAQNFFTREINLVADLSSFRSNGDVQTALAIGGSVRIMGIGRTIGNAYYRGWDLDVGARIGPGLLFEFRESRADKNRRFSLFLEPFVRVVARPGRTAFYAELGAQRPVLRAGFWIPVGR